jgi:hypothetical protein
VTTDPFAPNRRQAAQQNETSYLCAGQMPAHISRGTIVALAIFWASLALAQETRPPQAHPEELPPAAAPIPEQTQISPVAPCLQPPPVVRWQDYQGPLQKVVGAFGRRLERKSVGTPHYKSGTVLCSLTLGGKFLLFAADTFDPITFLSVGFNSGLDQAQNNQPAFGQGAAGYGKRFGYNFSLQASGEFFSVVVYSTIFREDPRYYRLGYGSPQRRFVHALRHTIIAKREDGAEEFNFSEWLGVTSTAAIASAYHTGGRTGVGPAAEGIAITLAENAGWNVLREFWPEVAREFKLPFRGINEPRQNSDLHGQVQRF